MLYYLAETDGNAISQYRISPALVQSEMSLKNTPIVLNQVSPENLAELRLFMRVCQERNIEVRLLIAPYHPSYGVRLNISAWKDRLQGELGEDVKIWDYSRAVSDDNFFADRVHTNIHGVNQVTRIMAASGILDLDDEL